MSQSTSISDSTTIDIDVATLTVRALFEAVERGDQARFASLWAEDASWQNMPFGTVRGRDAIVRWWKPFLKKPGSFSVEFAHIACDGATVLTERIDRVKLGPIVLAAPVSGIFEVYGGQVCSNREYWDVLSLLRTTLRSWLAAPSASAEPEPIADAEDIH